jgi:hypothetical protein
MIFNREKNLIAWNKDTLDTYHDIVVSFDFARYSLTNVPIGGFCIAFFETELDVPGIGGPGNSLGYTPSVQSDYCYLKGYQGMKGAFLGVGFDSLGMFGAKTSLVDGLSAPIPNSCTLRGTEENNYNYIASSKNLTTIYRNRNFFINEKVSSEDKATYKTIKVIVSKAFTNIEVQVKFENEKEFVTVLNQKIPIKRRTGVKVGLTCTTEENDSKFYLKNFNVTGFPGEVIPPELTECAYTLKNQTEIPGNTIVSSNNFCAIPVDGNVNVYEVRAGQFKIKQILTEGEPIVLLGGNEKFLFTGNNKTTNVSIFYKANDQFLYSGSVDLLDDGVISPLEVEKYPPTCADTDNKFLAVGNNKNVFLYKFETSTDNFIVFRATQTLVDNVSGDIGYQVQIDGEKLLTSGGTERLGGRYNSFVSFYDYNGLAWSQDPVQTFSSPTTGNLFDEFGYSISMIGNEVIIGSPNEYRRRKNTVGQGEVYHYVYTKARGKTTKEWRPAMGLGAFYNIDSPGGNFGTHVSYLGNNLIVSAPYENYHFPPDLILENLPNCGRIYVFRKNRGGTFSQAAVIAPGFDEKTGIQRARAYMLYGRLVGLLGRTTAVATVPYNNRILYAPEIDVYKVGCLFATPPPHLPISINSIALYDNAGYTIDMETYTYLQLIDYTNVVL